MNKMFEKIIAKKKAEGKPMSSAHKEAKGSVLSDLMEHLGSMGLDKVKGMKKISIASDSKEGLKKGLSKAEEMVEGGAEAADDSEMSDHGQGLEASEDESPEHEMMESPEEEKSEEDKDAEIAELKAQLAKLQMKA